MIESKPFAISVRGDLACFTRPELKAERVSYPIPTPSALRGILEAVLWKPAIVWRIDEIRVLKPISYIQFRRNEVNGRLAVGTAESTRKSGDAWNYYADEDRAQRNTIALRDVAYIVTAHMAMTARSGPEDSIRKFEEMFERRLQRGQHVMQPALGCREFPAYLEPVDELASPIQQSEDLGWMLHDIHFGAENEPVFFHAVMTNGIVSVPPFLARKRGAQQS
jgi:CRISPR-associated protein Cas5d